MTEVEWREAYIRVLGVYEAGDAADVTDEAGQRLSGDSLMLLFTASDQAVDVALVLPPVDGSWRLALDTARPAEPEGARAYPTGASYPLQPRSLAILTRPSG